MKIRTPFRRLVILTLLVIVLGMVSIARAEGNHISSPASLRYATDGQSNNALSSEALVLTDTQSQYHLGLHLGILEDKTGNLTIGDVSAPASSSRFTQSPVDVPIFGYTNSAYWVRFILENETTATTEFLLEMSFPNTQLLDLYIPKLSGGGYEVKQSGALRPISSRDIAYPNFIFDLKVPLNQQITYFMRLKSGASMTIPLTLWTKNAFIVQSGQQVIMHWLIFGGLLALLVYHVFLLIKLKEATYLYFVTMLASMLIFLLDYSGYLTVYFFPNITNAKFYIIPLYVAGLYASIILFSDSFLELKTRQPKLHVVNIGLLVAWGLLIVLAPFVSFLNLSRIGTPLQLVTIATTWVVGIIAWRKGARSFGFFMIAWLGMAASLFLLLLVRVGIVPSTYLDENIFQFGFLLMAVSWSIALADRISELKAASETVNQELRASEQKLAQILDGLPLGIVVYNGEQKPTYINQRTSEIIGNPHLELSGNPDSETSFSDALDQFPFRIAGSDEVYPVEKTPLYRALNGSTASADDIELIRGNERILLEIWASPIRDNGKIKSAVAVFQDITQRKQAEAELLQHRDHLEELVKTRTTELDQVNQQLEMTLEWLSAVIGHKQIIKGASSLDDVYRELTSKVQELLGASMVFIMRWDYKNDILEALYNTPHDMKTPEMEFIRDAFQRGTLLRESFEIGKIATWSRDQVHSLPEPFKRWLHDHDVEFLIIAPMLVAKSFIGGLGIAGSDKLKDEFQRSEDLIERMAFDLASLTQDAILLDNTLALVASEERNRLARDLHDSVTQMLFTATLLTDVMPQIWRRDPEQGFQTLDKLRRLTRGALAEMRTLLVELRPSAVFDIPLSELLSQLTEAITSRSGVPFQLAIEQIPLLPNDVQMNFYRIAQEALNNVVKHAQAIRVTVSLGETLMQAVEDGNQDRQVKLMVQDDGVGFSTGIEKPGHIGINIMRERAAAIHADLSIESQPGHGTLVSLVWTGGIKALSQNE